MKWGTVLILLILWHSICAGQPAKEPSTTFLHTEEVNLWNIPKTRQQLQQASIELRTKLETLPNLNDSLQFESYGYHGGYLPKLNELPEAPRWTLDLTYNHNISLTKIILVPAADHRFGRLSSYGFPRRFRLSTIADDGSVSLIKEWMDEDCPDPERYPLIVDVPTEGSHRVRMEVFRGAEDGNREFLALDELYGIMGTGAHPCLNIEVSSEYVSPPYWEKRFMIDRQNSLGLPLDVRDSAHANSLKDDFVATFDRQPNEDPVIELDLGQNRKLGWVALFPAQSTDAMIPGFGFPEKWALEVIRENPKGERGIIRRVPWEWDNKRPGNNVVRLAGADHTGRWIRLYVNTFPLSNGKPTFAMGEIHVYRKDMTYPIDTIRLVGFPEGAEADTTLMHNGHAGGYPILFMLDWLQQIEQRREVTKKLQKLSDLDTRLQARWSLFWKKVSLAMVTLVIFSAILFAIIQTVSRKQHSKRLRLQISSDLHDDIGSKVAAISLASTFIEKAAQAPKVRERGARIRAITADMHQGLRDVLWLTDTRTDTLTQVVQKLIDSAKVNVAAEQLQLTASPVRSIPARPVPLQRKRDILLFFKEALHNATAHSNADQIKVEILAENKKLLLKVKDNGNGFNLDEVDPSDPAHNGLWTMRLRATRLHAQFSLKSAPAQGTLVELKFDV